jgi:hypothetical protein
LPRKKTRGGDRFLTNFFFSLDLADSFFADILSISNPTIFVDRVLSVSAGQCLSLKSVLTISQLDFDWREKNEFFTTVNSVGARASE